MPLSSLTPDELCCNCETKAELVCSLEKSQSCAVVLKTQGGTRLSSRFPPVAEFRVMGGRDSLASAAHSQTSTIIVNRCVEAQRITTEHARHAHPILRRRNSSVARFAMLAGPPHPYSLSWRVPVEPLDCDHLVIFVSQVIYYFLLAFTLPTLLLPFFLSLASSLTGVS